ncbi:hypothetical protein F0562_013674 [Nyssa sinensis]|uniref:BHLH domain-containing protein n=1 Tax=Nyssa sinensis TaxID=561372 RepID=A0A5J4ZQU2_9ASTE|nr:hypothetical protein F0562_013674 [Nyssa sinensis]
MPRVQDLWERLVRVALRKERTGASAYGRPSSSITRVYSECFSTATRIFAIAELPNSNGLTHVVESSVKKPNGESLSTQSTTVRPKRRKITEKTQEFEKLILGGHKMNTVDMFQAAFNYINYLRAQLGIRW